MVGVQTREPLVHGRDALRADHQLRQGIEVVGDDFQASVEAVLVHEPFLDAHVPAAPETDRHMAHFHVLLEGQRGADLRVALPHHADVFFLKKQLRRVTVNDVPLGHDHQVDLAAHQQFAGIVAGAEHLERDVGRFLMDLLDHLGEQHADQIIRGHQAKMPLASGGIEHWFGRDGRLDRQQHFAHRFGQFQRVGRGLHLAPDLHQQFVLEVGAQSAQHAAGGRLGHVQALGGTGDVLLLEQHIERDQQVQVQMIETHGQVRLFVFIFAIRSDESIGASIPSNAAQRA